MSTEPSSQQDPQTTEQSSLQIDMFGIKAQVRPVQPDEPEPRTWKEVWDNVHQCLRTLVVEPFRIVVDVLKSTRSIVRGIGNLEKQPGAAEKRISRAHIKTDAREDQKQAEFQSSPQPVLPPAEAVADVEAILRRLQAQGVPIRVGEIRPGVTAFIIVHPELQREAVQLAKEESKLLGLPNKPDDADNDSDDDSSS